MIVSCSMKGIVNKERPKQGIGLMVNAGFRAAFWNLEIGISELGQADMDRVLGQCVQSNLDVAVVHAPFLPEGVSGSENAVHFLEYVKECIRSCGRVGCKYIVVPLPELETEMERFYRELVGVALENGVTILLENQCKEINGHFVRGVCSDARKAAQWVDELNKEAGEEVFGFCVDAGNLNLCGQNILEFVKVLGKNIKAVVLRDGNGLDNVALLPFTYACNGGAQMDWRGVILGLREIGFDGHLLLELSDTAMAFPPSVRGTLLIAAKNIADYFAWQIRMETVLQQYESLVLFGAGNMCRNYMECYGGTYRPLFACDNNQKLWGTTFCDLEVKSPESLRDLPEGCCVLICNVYYQEIEKQLLEMGVTNYEFFSDEFLPAVCADERKGVWA